MAVFKKYGFTITGAPDDILNNMMHTEGIVIIRSKDNIVYISDLPADIWSDPNLSDIPKTD